VDDLGPSRADLVAGAAEDWADQLAAVGGRSTLLHFRDLKVGTLDLAAADAEARKRLVDGEPTPVSRLFPHDPLRSSATRSARAIRAKSHELLEERGLHCCHLAVGIATWSEPFAARRPTAPVLLRPARVEQVGASGDLLVTVSTEPQVNPVLLRAMAEQLGLRIEPDDLLDPSGELRYATVVEKLREFAPPHVVDGFSVAHRAVLGTFCNAAVSLTHDLRTAGGQLVGHDVVAAVAGDARALDALRARARLSADELAGAGTAWRDELFVLDADAGQEAAVRGAAAGDTVLLASPGTGTTQTVVNLAAILAGRGRSLLVVAAHREDALGIAQRLGLAGIGAAVLDARDGRPRRELAADLAETLRLADTDPQDEPEDLDTLVADVTARRDALAAHRETMHRPREPWGISAYAAQAAVAGTPPSSRSEVRLAREAVAHLHGDARSAARAALREYADIGGITLGPEDSPWHGSAPMDPADAREAGDRVVRLRDRELARLRDVATRAAVEVGLPGPARPAEAFDSVRLVERGASVLGTFRTGVWEAPLDRLVEATAERAWRREHGSGLGWLTRRRLRRDAAELLRDPSSRPERADLHTRLVEARSVRDEWARRARDGRPPRFGAFHHDALAAAASVAADLDGLATTNPRTAGIVDLSWAAAHQRLAELAGDEGTLLKLPRLRELAATLDAAGLSPLVEELRARSADAPTALVAFDHAWHASLLDAWRIEDDAYGSVDPQQLDAQAAAYRDADSRLLEVAASAVRRAHLAGVRRAREEHPGQAALLAAQLSAPAHPRGIADLVRAAPETTLALKPCWIVSPYAVADVLPARRLFDVVVVLGAGTLTPAEAVPALLRGGRVVLAGGAHERVPPPFSVAVEDAAEDDDGSAPRPRESLLEVLGPQLPVQEISWHHAARHERLVAFVNRRVHTGRLVSTPSAFASGEPETVRHVLVEGAPDTGDPVESTGAEVRRVVDLVVEHARSRPYESLAVVSLSVQHARRVETAVRVAISREPELDGFFAEDREERFVVTDLAHPPAGSRDALVLTLGYGRTVDGRVLYRFGPLAHPGGEMGLAAVLARTRSRFTLVSSFSAAELNARRLTSEGARVLGDLLSYVESGAATGSGAGSDVADPLEDAVRLRLQEAGVPLVAHLGKSARRVGLALHHPRRAGRFVLAVDTDGPAWASSGCVRESDRIVPEELERRGWRTHRVWSAAWAADQDRETRRLLDAYTLAVAEADTYDAAVTAAVNDAVVGPPDEAVEAARSGEVARPERPRDPRPAVRPGRPVGGYSLVELVSLARWVESDARLRTEREAAAEVAAELGLDATSGRVDQLLRHAVRAGRAAGAGPNRDDGAAVDVGGGQGSAPPDLPAEDSSSGSSEGSPEGLPEGVPEGLPEGLPEGATQRPADEAGPDGQDGGDPAGG
jgi:REase_MTES_1575/Protein of unknown function (DUF4011)